MALTPQVNALVTIWCRGPDIIFSFSVGVFVKSACARRRAQLATRGDDNPRCFHRQPRPVQLGLVASLARPNGNLTGINLLSSELVTKRLEILRELVPTATRVGVLVNPANPTTSEVTVRLVEAGGRAMGLQVLVLNASTSREIHAAFATLARERPTEAHGRRLAQMRSLIAASPLAAQILAGGASRNTRREPKSR